MREIKFRAYNKHTKKMYKVEGLSFRHNNIIVASDIEAERQQKLGDFEIIQYIGLKDKNGKEIYEGDILRLYNEEYDNYELFIEVIFNYKACFWGKKIKNNTDDLGESDILYNYNLDITEIIGNIYENPELINN